MCRFVELVFLNFVFVFVLLKENYCSLKCVYAFCERFHGLAFASAVIDAAGIVVDDEFVVSATISNSASTLCSLGRLPSMLVLCSDGRLSAFDDAGAGVLVVWLFCEKNKYRKMAALDMFFELMPVLFALFELISCVSVAGVSFSHGVDFVDTGSDGFDWAVVVDASGFGLSLLKTFGKIPVPAHTVEEPSMSIFGSLL